MKYVSFVSLSLTDINLEERCVLDDESKILVSGPWPDRSLVRPRHGSGSLKGRKILKWWWPGSRKRGRDRGLEITFKAHPFLEIIFSIGPIGFHRFSEPPKIISQSGSISLWVAAHT